MFLKGLCDRIEETNCKEWRWNLSEEVQTGDSRWPGRWRTVGERERYQGDRVIARMTTVHAMVGQGEERM